MKNKINNEGRIPMTQPQHDTAIPDHRIRTDIGATYISPLLSNSMLRLYDCISRLT
jgi:hypothetical protein